LLTPAKGKVPEYDAVADPSPYKPLTVRLEVEPLKDNIIPASFTSTLVEDLITKSVKVDGIDEKVTLEALEASILFAISSNVFAIMPPQFRIG
jgi:hypothetical protein